MARHSTRRQHPTYTEPLRFVFGRLCKVSSWRAMRLVGLCAASALLCCSSEAATTPTLLLFDQTALERRTDRLVLKSKLDKRKTTADSSSMFKICSRRLCSWKCSWDSWVYEIGIWWSKMRLHSAALPDSLSYYLVMRWTVEWSRTCWTVCLYFVSVLCCYKLWTLGSIFHRASER